MLRALIAGCPWVWPWSACKHTALCVLVLACACMPAAHSRTVQAPPRQANLLQAHRRLNLDAANAARQQPADWFSRDMEKMDELPNYNITKGKCHPTCKWTCGQSRCNTACKPLCEPPKCSTSCKKPIMSKCRRVCKEPQCAVVCPPGQCEHNECPGCQTVCNKPTCLLDCGQGRCESNCAEPVCTWDCSPDADCPKPECKLTCDAPKVCEFGNLEKRPEQGLAPYLGQDIVARGLGKVPAEHLQDMTPAAMDGAKAMEGANAMGGASEGTATLSSLTGDMGVEAKGVIEQTPVRWAIVKQFR
mmetsp:Transcript_119958/g.208335  ORF Transcript_119958/g.208335 Transcript_119958/m.208335 type:complete len:303 (-) Transcript_119958:82-990(-)